LTDEADVGHDAQQALVAVAVSQPQWHANNVVHHAEPDTWRVPVDPALVLENQSGAALRRR
jgi:hypothetical protein